MNKTHPLNARLNDLTAAQLAAIMDHYQCNKTAAVVKAVQFLAAALHHQGHRVPVDSFDELVKELTQ